MTISAANTIDTGAFALTLNGPVSNAGTLTKTGSGTLALNGANTSGNPTALNQGTIQAGSNTAIGGGGLAMADGTTLLAGTGGLVLMDAITTAGVGTLDAAGVTVTLGGPISGPGSIATGATGGNLVLNGSNGFTGLTITSGAATLGTATAGGIGGITVAGSATLAAGVSGLVLTNAVTTTGAAAIDSGPGMLTLASAVTGAGSITKIGTGTLTLTANNAYSGATTVAAGTLSVKGVNSGNGAVAAQSGATLAGDGSIAGVVTIANGATITPGAGGPGMLTTGGLVLGSSANLTYQLGQANIIGGPPNSLLQVNGDLTLGGRLSVADSGGFGTGVYRLINYTGQLTGNTGLAVVSLPGVYAGSVQTVVPGTVNLLITTPNALVQYWDGADVSGNGAIDGGSGSWTSTNANWTSAAPSAINSSWAGGVAVFSNTSGTVSVTGTQAVQGLQFTTPGYVLTGGTLNVSAGSFIATNGGTTTIGSTLTGGSITKQGAGTLALTGSNSFAALGIIAGTVSVGTNTASGSGNIALADGTTLAAGANGLQLTNTISTAGNGTIDTGANSLLLRSIVSGPGSITKLGSGTLVFNNTANSFANLDVVAGTIKSGGNLTFSSDNSFGTGTVVLGNGTTLAGNGGVSNLANAVNVTGAVRIDPGDQPPPPFQGGPIGVLRLSGNIAGSGTVTKVGTGILYLNGNNSFTGLTIAGGTVNASSSGVGTGFVALTDGTTLQGSGSYANAVSVTGGAFLNGNETLNGVVSGPGSITTTGALTLNGVNSFSGLTISGGSVAIGNNSAAGNGSINFAGIGTAGTPTLVAGESRLVLSNTMSTFASGTIDSGAGVFTLNGPISGLGSITKVGTGNLALNGNNSFNGTNGGTLGGSVQALTVSAGTVTLGTNTAAGTGAITISNGSTLAAGLPGLQIANAVQVTDTAVINTGTGTLTLTGQVSSLPNFGAGIVTKTGTGNLALTGFVSLAQLDIAAGRLTLDGASGSTSSGLTIGLADGTMLATTTGASIGGAVTTAGAGTIDSGVNGLIVGGTLSGAGGIVKIGNGTLTLAGGSTYAGSTTVAAGTFVVNSAASGKGAMTVQSGAKLTGNGTIAGIVSIADGATIAPGNNTGTLTTGGLILGNGASLAYRLGQANVIGGNLNSLLQVNGNLTLGGGLSVTNSSNFGSGVYRLINYTGALTNNGLQVASLPGGSSGQIQTAIGGTVNLVVAAPNALIQYWDGVDTAGHGRIGGGSANWTATATNWTSAAPGTINTSWVGGVAVFINTAGTVAVTGTQVVQGLQFGSAGYILTGGTLAATPGAFIATNDGTTTIASTISGTGALSKQGAGVLVLNGDNSFAGLNIMAGSVLLGSNTAGGTGTIALTDGATLAGTSGLILTNAVTTAGAGVVDSGTGVFALNGIVSGPGSIAKIGSGGLVLNAANGFNGLSINAGSVTLGTSTAGGRGGIALADGTTLAAGVGGLALADAVSTAGVGTIDSSTGIVTLNGIVSGPGSITKIGSGYLILNGSSSFNGLVINTGSVTLGNNAAAGTGNIALADGTTLAGATGVVLANTLSSVGAGTLNSGTGVFTLTGPITGPGSISKAGSGNLVLNGSNTFTGLAVNAGTVTVGSNTAAGIGDIALADGTTLAGNSGVVLANTVSAAGTDTIDSGAGVFTLAGPITGPGSVAKAGSGNLVLNGNNSFAGLAVDTGTVTLGSAAAASNGVIALADGATLAAGTTGLVLANAITTAGAGGIDSGAGKFTLDGNISGAVATRPQARLAIVRSSDETLVVAAGAGSGAASGSIVKLGSGNLVLNGINNFAGLTVTAGTVTIGNATAAGTGVVALAGGTTFTTGAAGLTFANAFTTAGVGTVGTNGFDLTLNGPISGPGSIVETGGGSLNLGGVSSYAGATTIANGLLRVSGSLTNSAVTVASGAMLRGTGSIGGLVASRNSIVAPGLGTTVGVLTVTGNATLLSGSTLAVNLTPATADRLTVTGSTALAGGLAVNQGPGLYHGTPYTIVSAGAGVSGAFTSITGVNLAFDPTLVYTSNSVLLSIRPKSLVTLLGGAGTLNESNLGKAFDAATAGSFDPTPYAPFYALAVARLGGTLNYLTGELHSVERRVAMDNTRYVREAALHRLGSGIDSIPGPRGGEATSGGDDHKLTIWGRGVGSWGSNSSDGNGSSFITSSDGGITGVDYSFEGGKVGALGSYTSTDVKGYALGRSTVESTGGGVYAGYRADHGFAIAAGGTMAHVKFNGVRSVPIPGLAQDLSSRASGTTYQTFVDVAYNLASGAKTRVEPFAKFAFVGLDSAGFAETGGSAVIQAARQSYDIEVTTAGLRGAVAPGGLKGFTLKGSIGAQHTGGNRAARTSLALAILNSPAGIDAIPVDRWAVAADVSGEFRLARNATFAVGYSGVNGQRTSDNGVRGTLIYEF